MYKYSETNYLSLTLSGSAFCEFATTFFWFYRRFYWISFRTWNIFAHGCRERLEIFASRKSLLKNFDRIDKLLIGATESFMDCLFSNWNFRYTILVIDITGYLPLSMDIWLCNFDHWTISYAKFSHEILVDSVMEFQWRSVHK